MTLTNKQRIFVEEYLKCWNATAAAIAAGYSEKTARVTGPENLLKPEIAQEIDRRKAEVAMTADEALTRLGEQARGAHTAYIRNDGTVDLSGLKAAGLMHLVKGTRRDRHGHLIVEFYDAQAALDKFMRYHGLYHDRLAVDIQAQIATEIEIVRNAGD